jgi:beta-hydroxylase
MRRPFFPISDYPELKLIQQNWRELRCEGERLCNEMIWIQDERTDERVWAFAPLQPEKDDKDPYLNAVSQTLRDGASLTVDLVNSIQGVLGYGFSLLRAQSRIRSHAHSNPFVTAMLGLRVGDSCFIKVGGLTRRIRSGRMLIFDYTLPHGVSNESLTDRLVLLILLPNKSLCADETLGQRGVFHLPQDSL